MQVDGFRISTSLLHIGRKRPVTNSDEEISLDNSASLRICCLRNPQRWTHTRAIEFYAMWAIFHLGWDRHDMDR